MIKIRIRNDDHEIDLQFPISENKLYAKLAEIHAIEGKDAPQSAFVTEVYWPEELSMLKDRFANLDELNYLARRMESFDYHEYDQFLIGITKLENPTEKDLINLTFNLDHFTLCKDVSSYGKIGREYVMNTEGAVPAHDEDDPKYAAIGKALIDRGLAQITAKGLLIYNPFDELTEVYDGQTFPEYYYENTLASAEVSYNGRTELLLLPGEELAIQKALARLGAPSDSDCEIRFCLSKGEDDAWEERIEGIIRSEGLYEANKMLRFLDTGDMDWGKLTAAVELTDAKSAANIGAVAEHLGEFAYIPDAKSESDVGHFLVDNVEEYEMNIEMEEYFDFSGFGEYFAEEHDGQFVNGGFVYFDSDRSLDEFLGRGHGYGRYVSMIINAVIESKDGGTLVLDFPRSIYDVYEKLQSVGIRQSPHQITLSDEEGDDVRVKLYSEDETGKHLLLTLKEQNSLADANMLAFMVDNAKPDFRSKLEQNLLNDQYSSMQEVTDDIKQMLYESGPVKAVFYCPLVGEVTDEEGFSSPVDGRFLKSYAWAVEEALEADTADDEMDMAEFFDEDDGVKAKLVSAKWGVETYRGQLFGRIECSLKEELTDAETEILTDWISGQNSDGYGEHFEQQPIDTEDGDLYVSFWNSGDNYSIMTRDELDEYIDNQGMTMGGM